MEFVNRAELKEQLCEVIRHSQDGIPNPQVDDLIDTWYEKKKEFINSFGGLIWECPEKHMTFEMSKTQKQKSIQNFITYIYYHFPGHTDLADFIEKNEETFFENKTCVDYAYKDKLIPKGSKLIKSFKNFISNPNILNDAQTKASMVIQENNITGTLCISVHPLDFLSSSENTYNWRSCHALDGEYRAGNLSYMLDDTTVICYLKGEEDAILPNFPTSVPWNNKKWRMLANVSKDRDIIFAGRQYPFTWDEVAEVCRRSLLKALKVRYDFSYCSWTDPVIKQVLDSNGKPRDLSMPYICIGEDLYRMNEVIRDAMGSLQYNDLLYSTVYSPHYTRRQKFAMSEDRPKLEKIVIGAPCKCLRCNTKYISESITFMCEECDIQYGAFDSERHFICDCCGTRGPIIEAEEYNGEVFCHECASQLLFLCPCCGQMAYEDGKAYDKYLDDYICEECYNYRKDDC